VDELKFAKALSTERFYKEVEVLVNTHNLNYMDAVVFFCEKNDIEVETAASMIRSNQRIKSHIQTEGEALNFLPKTAKLPI
jgi:hypothetical protein